MGRGVCLFLIHNCRIIIYCDHRSVFPNFPWSSSCPQLIWSGSCCRCICGFWFRCWGWRQQHRHYQLCRCRFRWHEYLAFGWLGRAGPGGPVLPQQRAGSWWQQASDGCLQGFVAVKIACNFRLLETSRRFFSQSDPISLCCWANAPHATDVSRPRSDHDGSLEAIRHQLKENALSFLWKRNSVITTSQRYLFFVC